MQDWPTAQRPRRRECVIGNGGFHLVNRYAPLMQRRISLPPVAIKGGFESKFKIKNLTAALNEF
ncbi:protein of unknown function [Burkholderia multivorans]